MVNHSFKQLFVFVFVSLISGNIIAESKLVLVTDKTESTLGRPIRVELYGVSLKGILSDIKLNKLKNNFGIVIDYSTSNATDKRWPNQSIQILRLKLFPRKVGKLKIPKLSISNISTEEKLITVLEGDTSSPQVSYSSLDPYERQQIIVHVNITSSNSISRLSIKDVNVDGFESKLLPFKRVLQNDGAYLLSIGWALAPFKSGTKLIELPPIEYSESGVIRKRFFLPLISSHSKMLPQYLPPTIPVGKVIMHGKFSPSSFLKKDSISYLEIQLKGHFNNAYMLPPVLRQLKSSTYIQFLPVNSLHTTEATNTSLTSTVTHSIPYKSLENGFLKLPEIRIQYFDPENSKIKTIIYQPDNIFVLGMFFRSLIIVLLLLIISGAVRLSFKKWQKFKNSKFTREQAMVLLQNPAHIQDVREAISLLSTAECWPANITLSQWELFWMNKYKTNADFHVIINQLSSAFYSSNFKYNLYELGQNLLHYIKCRKKL